MNRQLRDAYYVYLDGLARAGIIDHALNNAILEGKSVEEHILETLRAVGRLPDGWDQTDSQRAWHIATVTGDHWRILSIPRAVMASPVRRVDVQERHARLRRADLAHAS